MLSKRRLSDTDTTITLSTRLSRRCRSRVVLLLPLMRRKYRHSLVVAESVVMVELLIPCRFIDHPFHRCKQLGSAL
jgi:hypothetical protein